jgi:hypothetical protein
MKQSRATSFLKSAVSTAVGFIVALGANALVLPLFGFHPNLAENLQITSIYTVISIARGYLLERAFEALGWRTRMSAFAVAVLAERARQKAVEGWSELDDDRCAPLELANAGAAYATTAGLGLAHPPRFWPWYKTEWKPYSLRRDLIRAGALILAEGERADRMRTRKAAPGAASEPKLEERRVHV